MPRGPRTEDLTAIEDSLTVAKFFEVNGGSSTIDVYIVPVRHQMDSRERSARFMLSLPSGRPSEVTGRRRGPLELSRVTCTSTDLRTFPAVAMDSLQSTIQDPIVIRTEKLLSSNLHPFVYEDPADTSPVPKSMVIVPVQFKRRAEDPFLSSQWLNHGQCRVLDPADQRILAVVRDRLLSNGVSQSQTARRRLSHPSEETPGSVRYGVTEVMPVVVSCLFVGDGSPVNTQYLLEDQKGKLRPLCWEYDDPTESTLEASSRCLRSKLCMEQLPLHSVIRGQPLNGGEKWLQPYRFEAGSLPSSLELSKKRLVWVDQKEIDQTQTENGRSLVECKRWCDWVKNELKTSKNWVELSDAEPETKSETEE